MSAGASPFPAPPSWYRPFPPPSALPQPHRATKGTAGPASDASEEVPPPPGPDVPPGGGRGNAAPRLSKGPAAGKGPPPSKGMSLVPLPERA